MKMSKDVYLYELNIQIAYGIEMIKMLVLLWRAFELSVCKHVEEGNEMSGGHWKNFTKMIVISLPLSIHKHCV